MNHINEKYAKNSTPTYPNFMQVKSSEPTLGSIGWGIKNPKLNQDHFEKT